MYKKFIVFHHLILSKDYVAHFPDQILKFTDQIFVNCRPANNQQNYCNIKFVHFSMCRQYLQFTFRKELFSEEISHRFSSKVFPANMQQIYSRKPIRKRDFKKSCVAHLLVCSVVDLLGICRAPFKKNTSGGLVLCFISIALVQVMNNTFY